MSSKTSKVGVIGAGNVGANVANALVLLRKCVRVVLFDLVIQSPEISASVRLMTTTKAATKSYDIIGYLVHLISLDRI